MLRWLIIQLLPYFVVVQLRKLKERFRTESPLSDNPSKLLGMTTHDEQTFYEECTRGLEEIRGAVVDLGCWMGSTSIALARGMTSGTPGNPRSSGKLIAFDQFEWKSWMDPFQGELSCDYQPGESFLPEARRRVRTHTDNVELRCADLTQYVWQEGPIQLLLVDAMKNIALAEKIANSFFPHLLSESILIHQDYKHYYTPWIHVLQYRLRDFFSPLKDIPGSGTTAFTLTRSIPSEMLGEAARLEHISDREMEAAIRFSLTIVCDESKSAVAAAHIMHFVHAGDVGKAQALVEHYHACKMAKTPDIAIAEQKVAEMG